MADLDVTDVLPVESYKDPVKIKEEDFGALKTIQAHVDALTKYRQEIGRMYQMLNNLTLKTNEVEIDLSKARNELAGKYQLSGMGGGQWVVDFETREFVRLETTAPVVP